MREYKAELEGGLMIIDIEKPFETSSLEPDEDGIIEYCPCQYVVFGKAPKDFIKRLDDVTISLASSYPDINLTEDYLYWTYTQSN